MKTTTDLKKTLTWFTIFIVINISLSFFLPILFWVNFIYDDGCFYVKTAYNFSQGFGSTFDGVNPTNGYQPLWFIVLAAVFYVISLFAGGLSPQFLIRITIFIHFLLLYLTFYYTYRSFRIILPKHSVFASVFLSFSLCITPVFIRNVGMETSIATLLFAVYFWIKCREIVMKEDHFIYKIILLMLVVLTRVDFLSTLVPILILYECYDKDLRKYFGKLVRMSFPVILTAILYFLNNYYNFGNFFTVSSFTKSHFGNIYLIQEPGHLLHFFTYQAILSADVFILSAIVLFLVFKPHSEKGSVWRQIEIFLLWILIGFILFTIQNILFNKEILREWYFAGPIFFMAISVTLILKNSRFLKASLAFVFMFVFIYYTYNARVVHQKYDSFYDYALELKELVPEGDEVLQIDYSGMIGLLSERRVVNGDGLINSFEFNEHVKNNTMKEYIKKYHIDYFSTYMAVIDSSTNTITSAERSLGGWELTFPIEKIVYRKPQNFDSYYNPKQCEWFLISLK
jgi:hypothetical protein